MRAHVLFLPIALAATLGIPSCKPETTAPPTAVTTVPAPTDAPPELPDAHDDHPTEGPHHGELIELGAEEYHAELLHTDTAVTIYVLDGAAKSLVPIAATTLTVNAIVAGKPTQFPLAAAPVESDPAGKASRFTSADKALMAAIDDHDSKARLMITIADKPYVGVIDHHHDGDHKHDHAHEK